MLYMIIYYATTTSQRFFACHVVQSQLLNQMTQQSGRVLMHDLNTFRSNPSHLEQTLAKRKGYYNAKNMLFSPHHPHRSLQTSQGARPVNELLGQLVNDRPMPQLELNEELAGMAQHLAEYYRYCQDTGKKFTSEVGPAIREKLNKSQKYDFNQEVNCVIGVGFREDKEPLISALINDGDDSRSGRRLLMDQEMRVCGIGVAELGETGLVCGIFLLTRSAPQK